MADMQNAKPKKKAVKVKKTKAEDKSETKTMHRVWCRLSDDEYERLSYWAKKRDMSQNEYFKLAIDRAIAFENRDYDLPTAEIARLNQMRDMVVSINNSFSSLEDIVVKGFDSLLGLARGDNNYLRDEDGIL